MQCGLLLVCLASWFRVLLKVIMLPAVMHQAMRSVIHRYSLVPLFAGQVCEMLSMICVRDPWNIVTYICYIYMLQDMLTVMRANIMTAAPTVVRKFLPVRSRHIFAYSKLSHVPSLFIQVIILRSLAQCLTTHAHLVLTPPLLE
jgi:hypothetical protein